MQHLSYKAESRSEEDVMKGRESIGRDISSLSTIESHRTRGRSELRTCLDDTAQPESIELEARPSKTTSTL